MPAPRRPSRAMRASCAAAPCSRTSTLDRHLHGVRELAQQQHRDVALAGLELREVALGHARGEGERLARHGVRGAPGAHAVAQAPEVGGFGLVFAVQRARRGAHGGMIIVLAVIVSGCIIVCGRMKINILVGTMTGTAQMCAQEMELALDGDDVQVATLLMDKLDPSVFADREAVYLICTSTYGQGDVPDNAKALYEALCTQAAGPGARALRRVRPGRPHLRRDLQLRRQALRRASCRRSARERIGERYSTTPRAACCPRRSPWSGRRRGWKKCAQPTRRRRAARRGRRGPPAARSARTRRRGRAPAP